MLLEPGGQSRDRPSASPSPEAVQQAMASMSGIQGQDSTMQMAFCAGCRICRCRARGEGCCCMVGWEHAALTAAVTAAADGVGLEDIDQTASSVRACWASGQSRLSILGGTLALAWLCCRVIPLCQAQLRSMPVTACCSIHMSGDKCAESSNAARCMEGLAHMFVHEGHKVQHQQVLVSQAGAVVVDQVADPQVLPSHVPEPNEEGHAVLQLFIEALASGKQRCQLHLHLQPQHVDLHLHHQTAAEARLQGPSNEWDTA